AAARTEGEGMPGVRSRSAGALEALVMQALSSTGTPMSARTIQATFEDPAPAQTTVLTVLSRLEGKGLVTRHAPPPTPPGDVRSHNEQRPGARLEHGGAARRGGGPRGRAAG